MALIFFFSNGDNIDPHSPEKLLDRLRSSSGSIERPVRSYYLSDNVFNDNLNKVVQCGIKGTVIVTRTRPAKQQIQTLQGLLDEEAKETEREMKKNEEDFQINRLDDISNDGSRLPKKIKKMQPDFEIFGIMSDKNNLIGFGITEKN